MTQIEETTYQINQLLEAIPFCKTKKEALDIQEDILSLEESLDACPDCGNFQIDYFDDLVCSNNFHQKAIQDVDDLKANTVYQIFNTQFNVEYQAKCLGNYGPVKGKVYFAKLPTDLTPETFAARMKANIYSNSAFVCWDHNLNTSYIISQLN